MSRDFDTHAIGDASRKASVAFERFRRSVACTGQEAVFAMIIALADRVPADKLDEFKATVADIIDAREPARAMIEREVTGARTQ